jgi:hypothetical protein
VPDWFQTFGPGAWLLAGIAVLLAIAFFVLGLISDLVIPLVFAAILATISVPPVGWNAGACPGAANHPVRARPGRRGRADHRPRAE